MNSLSVGAPYYRHYSTGRWILLLQGLLITTEYFGAFRVQLQQVIEEVDTIVHLGEFVV